MIGKAKHTIRPYFAFAALVSMLLLVAAVGCKDRSKLPKPDISSALIKKVKMSAKTCPELANTFFSIDHRAGTIYNARPLPFGSKIEKVKVELQTLEENKIEIYVAGKLVTPDHDSIDLAPYKEGIRIQVSSPSEGLHKTYELHLAVYESDPTKITWTKSSSDMPADPGRRGYHIELAEAQGAVYFFGYEDRNAYYRAPHSGGALQWKKEELPLAAVNPNFIDFAVTRRGSMVTKARDRVAVQEMTDAGPKISTWDIEGGSVLALLGAIDFEQEGVVRPRPLLMVASDDGQIRFAAFDTHQGKLLLGAAVPSAFPHQDFTRLSIEEAHYPLAMVAGGHNASATPNSFVWTTTTGLDWLSPHSKEPLDLPDTKIGRVGLLHDQETGRFYLISPGSSAEAWRIYLSDDRGATWQRGEPKIMLPQELYTASALPARSLFASFAHKHTLYILYRAADGSLEEWRGVPDIYAQN